MSRAKASEAQLTGGDLSIGFSIPKGGGKGEFSISTKTWTSIEIYKEVKSARESNVDPPDCPGSRMHCPAPVLTGPLKPQN